ncbi:MAG: protein FxsA [Solirubrobacterales bacterium]|nr:protein FxsA [Solirubrobacterales bacterium]
MPLLLLILFIAIPIAELYVIIQVGNAIGVLPTIALLIADSVLGTLLLRHQGRTAWRRFMAALEESRMPHREVFDGAMVILGGALLLTPGFITDVFGIICLLPPTRAVLWQVSKRLVVSRVSFGPTVAAGYGRARERYGQPPSGGRSPSGGPRPDDIVGTAEEVPENGDNGNALPEGDRGRRE